MYWCLQTLAAAQYQGGCGTCPRFRSWLQNWRGEGSHPVGPITKLHWKKREEKKTGKKVKVVTRPYSLWGVRCSRLQLLRGQLFVRVVGAHLSQSSKESGIHPFHSCQSGEVSFVTQVFNRVAWGLKYCCCDHPDTLLFPREYPLKRIKYYKFLPSIQTSFLIFTLENGWGVIEEELIPSIWKVEFC